MKTPLFASFVLVGLSAAARGGSIVGLGVLPGGSASYAAAVSADGSVVVGHSLTAGYPQAFRWTDAGGMQGLGAPPSAASWSLVGGVSGDGSTVVGERFTGTGNEAFRWTEAGGIQSLGLPSGTVGSGADGVSYDGSVIVGGYESVGQYQAYRCVEGIGFQPLGDLTGGDLFSDARSTSADGSVVAGVSSSGSGDEAFRWTENGGMIGLGDLAGGIFQSQARAVSADGKVIVGDSVIGDDRFGKLSQAFRWTDSGGMQGLGSLDGSYSYAYGASGDGSLIVGSTSYDSNDVAFVWNEYLGMRRLSEVLTSQGTDLTGWRLASADGISADGRYVVGTGSYNGLSQAFRAELAPLPVPEPTTFAMLGLGGLTFLKSRNRGRTQFQSM